MIILSIVKDFQAVKSNCHGCIGIAKYGPDNEKLAGFLLSLQRNFCLKKGNKQVQFRKFVLIKNPFGSLYRVVGSCSHVCSFF